VIRPLRVDLSKDVSALPLSGACRQAEKDARLMLAKTGHTLVRADGWIFEEDPNNPKALTVAVCTAVVETVVDRMRDAQALMVARGEHPRCRTCEAMDAIAVRHEAGQTIEAAAAVVGIHPNTYRYHDRTTHSMRRPTA
jgi:hypothetical protein